MGQKVKFKRKTTEEIDDLEIEDGSLIYNIENGKTYMDYGNQRIPTGGGSNGGIYVGEEEPTDPDVTLWVDTPISETKASEIVNEYTESDKVGYSTSYINGINGKILWTNPNPTSSFASQTLTIDFSNYDMYEILWYNSISNTILFNTGKIPIGIRTDLTFMYYSNNLSLRKREVSSITNSGITFDVAKENGTTDNTTCIPLYIIGYKTGLFS